RAVGFSLDGKHLSALSCDGDPSKLRPARLQTWDVASGKELRSGAIPIVLPERVLFTPDGRKLIVAVGGEMKVWDVMTGKEDFALAGHPGPVAEIRLTVDGKTVVTTSPGGIKAWDVATLRTRWGAPATGASRTSVIPGDHAIRFAGGYPGERVVELASGQPLASFPSYPTPLVSADGRVLVGARDNSTIEVVHLAAAGAAPAAR